jgi:CDP-glycerol glycerophosphotransferase (TagB/SpsB family)
MQYIYFLLNFFTRLIILLIPRNKNIWIFGAWYGTKYSDNPKFLFEFTVRECKDIKAIWICKEKSLHLKLKSEGLASVYAYSLKGIYYHCRAGVAIINQSCESDLIGCLISWNVKLVQLWHGIPLKKIGLDAITTVGGFRTAFRGLKRSLGLEYDLVTSTGHECSVKFESAFLLTGDEIKITGFPRNEVFNQKRTPSKSFLFKCIYMPTFRGFPGSEFTLLKETELSKINSQLEAKGIEITIRPHPVNVLTERYISLVSSLSNIKISNCDDIYSDIGTYDCLITDFSSIYFDFLLSNKPIVFFPYEMDNYKKNDRSLYYEYADVTIEPYCNTWSQVLDRVVEISKHGVDDKYSHQYKKLRNIFHSDISQNFCLNVVTEIYALLNVKFTKKE